MIITQTPVRLSLFGGNTDFREYYREREGRVLTATVDKYVYCIVKKRFDDLVIVNYSKREVVPSYRNVRHDIVRQAMTITGVDRGIEISFMADIPSRGTGLGSSSSVAVGVLNALHTYMGENVDAKRLAREAVDIEIDQLKKPIGVQDQYAVAVGGLKEFVFHSDDNVSILNVVMDDSTREDFNNSLMLFYTGVTRKSEEVLSAFNVKDNMDALDEKKMLADKGYSLLSEGNLKGFGKLLDESWQTKRKANTLTTNKEIDFMYEQAMQAGAYGGKLMGAGGGGFLLVVFPAHKRASIREALRDYKEMPFRFTDQGSKVILNV